MNHKQIQYLSNPLIFLYFGTLTYLSAGSDSAHDSIAAIGLTAFFCLQFTQSLKFFGDFGIQCRKLMIHTTVIYSGLCVGWLIASGDSGYFWNFDSHTMHVPNSINISDFLLGNSELRRTSPPFDKLYIVNWIVGFLYYLLGVSPLSHLPIFLILKLINCKLIFDLTEKLHSEKAALIAATFYLFNPVSFFYGVSYYKSLFLQFLIIFYFKNLSNFQKERRLHFLLVALVALSTISHERFYMAPILATSAVVVFLDKELFSKKFLPFFLLGGVGIWHFMLSKYFQGGLGSVVASLKGYREAYHSYLDVQNYSLPYLIDLARITLSPFPTLIKLEIFEDLSLLLFWGSPINHLIILMAILGMLKFRKASFVKVTAPPLILFLVLFAYIAPFNGRLREMYSPLICIYASFGAVMLTDYWRRKFGK